MDRSYLLSSPNSEHPLLCLCPPLPGGDMARKGIFSMTISVKINTFRLYGTSREEDTEPFRIHVVAIQRSTVPVPRADQGVL